MRASCRDVEAGTGWTRPSTIKATRALVSAGFIAKREGTATRPAAYLLRYAETLRMGGKAALPPVERNPQMRVVNWVDQVVKPVDHPNEENPSLFEMAPGVLSIDSKVFSVGSSISIDRATAEPAEPAPEKETAQLSGLMQYFVRHKCRWSNPHPPDKKILSTMHRVCEWEHLEAWLLAMIKSNEQPPANLGSPYAWLLSVAIQRIHGIQPEEQKPTLELLRGGKQMYTRWHQESLK